MTKEKTYKNFKGGLKTRAEFREFIPPMSKDAFNLLTENIKNDGYIRDPLVVWNDVILDGHHRYKIAESLDMTFKVKKETFKTDNDAKLWMLNNQIGSRRMSIDQLAVFALAYMPIYAELCKNRQKQGGKDKENMGKGLKTTELAAKKVGINAKIVGDIHTLNTYIPEVIPLIKAADYDGLKVAEVKKLKRRRDAGKIGSFVVDGKLTAEAEAVLKEIRETKKSKKSKKSNSSNNTGDGSGNGSGDGNENSSGDSSGDSSNNTDDGSGDENKTDPTTPGITQGSNAETEKNMEALKLQGFLDLLNKEVEKNIFTDKAKFLDGRVNTESLMPDFVLEYAKKTGGKYPKNIIIVVPNTELNSDWCQLASSVSGMYCDSSTYALRFLYFGNERSAFYNSYKKHGIVSAVLNKAPKQKAVPKQKAEIETLTPPKEKQAGA